MLVHVGAMLGLALLCGGWVLLQRWLARRDPELAGRVERSGQGCCGRCEQPADSKPSLSAAASEGQCRELGKRRH